MISESGLVTRLEDPPCPCPMAAELNRPIGAWGTKVKSHLVVVVVGSGIWPPAANPKKNPRLSKFELLEPCGFKNHQKVESKGSIATRSSHSAFSPGHLVAIVPGGATGA